METDCCFLLDWAITEPPLFSTPQGHQEKDSRVTRLRPFQQFAPSTASLRKFISLIPILVFFEIGHILP